MLTPDALIDAVRDVLTAHYHHLHPFNVRMHEGTLTHREIQLWVATRYYYQQAIPIKDAFVLAKLPTIADRRLWIERILNHDGRSAGEGGIEAWLRLGEAVGLDRADVEALVLVGDVARFAVDSYIAFCRERPWLEAVASSLTELFAPGLIDGRLRVFDTHYPWVERDGLEYFRRRLEQAPRDADHAVALVRAHAIAPAEQAAVLAAVRFKCSVLGALLDGVELAAARESGAVPPQVSHAG